MWYIWYFIKYGMSDSCTWWPTLWSYAWVKRPHWCHTFSFPCIISVVLSKHILMPRLRSTQPVTEAPVLGFLLALSSSEHQGLGTGVWPSCSYGFLSFSFAIPASKEGLAVLNGHAQSGVTDGYSLGTHCVPGLVLEQ